MPFEDRKEDKKGSLASFGVKEGEKKRAWEYASLTRLSIECGGGVGSGRIKDDWDCVKNCDVEE